MTIPLTPSQTAGPFLTIGLTWSDGPNVVPDGTAGVIRITGQVFDGAGAAVTDAVVETWQADPDGGFAHPDDPRGSTASGFRGFGRCATDDEGVFTIITVKPGRLPAEAERVEAPHIDVSVFARGLLDRLVTRIYFPDEADANAVDPLLATLSNADREMLVALPDGPNLRFDIHLQGDHGTPFFEL